MAALSRATIVRMPQDASLHQCEARLIREGWQACPAGRLAIHYVSAGTLFVATTIGNLRLPTGAVLVQDGRDAWQMRAFAGQVAEVLTVYPSMQWVRDLGAEVGPQGQLVAPLTPGVRDPGSSTSKLFAHLNHERRERTAGVDDAFLTDWLARFNSYEVEFLPQVMRCNGRSLARKRALFARLSMARAVLMYGDPDAGSVGSLAADLNISYAHFIRQFHHAFDVAPNQLRISRRMDLARELVATTDIPIREVMWRAGFDNYSAFSRAFRQHFGQSASELREARASGASTAPIVRQVELEPEAEAA